MKSTFVKTISFFLVVTRWNSRNIIEERDLLLIIEKLDLRLIFEKTGLFFSIARARFWKSQREKVTYINNIKSKWL